MSVPKADGHAPLTVHVLCGDNKATLTPASVNSVLILDLTNFLQLLHVGGNFDNIDLTIAYQQLSLEKES